MKKFFPLIIIAYLLYSVSGCGNNSVTDPSASTVTFTVSQQIENGNQFYFIAKPSLDVKLSQVVVKLGSDSDVITPTPNYTFSKDSFYFVNPNPYTGVSAGQIYSLKFTGTTSAGNTAFTTTTNYTVTP